MLSFFLCKNYSESRERVKVKYDLEAVGKCAEDGAERCARAAVIQVEVLSDMMDETMSHFDVICPTERSISPRLTPRRLPSYTFAKKIKIKKKKMFQWV